MSNKLTTNKENYLIEILRLQRDLDIVTNQELVKALNVSAPSVTEMLGILQKEGLINYTPYKGSTLSAIGEEKANAILRSHHAWEEFLISHLHYSKFDAHDLAHELEHVSDMELINRLESFVEEMKNK